MTEPIEHSPKELTTHTVFTTHKKPRPKTTINILRKGSIVKERCKQLAENALNLFPDRVLSDEDLTDLIFRYIGADKETIRAYKGYYGHLRAGRCGDNKIVGLTGKGYLELYDFFTRRGSKWIIHSQATLSYQAKESSSVGNESKEEISISLPQREESVVASSSLKSLNVVGGMGGNDELEEEEATEKDRNFTPMIEKDNPNRPRNLSPKIYPKISDEDDPNLAYLKLLAKAKPIEGSS